MGVGAGLYMCDVVKKFTFAISSPDEFLFTVCKWKLWQQKWWTEVTVSIFMSVYI